MAARDPRGVDPRGRPYDSRDFDHRRDFADDEHGEIPRAQQSSMAPRYSPQLQFPRDPRGYARDPRDYQQEYPREYDRDPRDFARDPREYYHREYHHPQQQQQHYDRQFPPSNPRPFRDDMFPQQPTPPSSVQHSSDDTSSIKSESIIQDEVLRAMKALKGEETPDPQQLLALYKQLQQLNLEGTAPTTSA
ncbi:hypothetical protein DYB30_007406 [Aphanomyces astaci]|uniref:Uncharacterized protein n=1 Tax=Aphanomyces astaci TaxID=112090 RepID=A0A397CXK9_APHAT|nr:hypothetical protein DYB30_007406 [Aphanomyces astaci]